MRVFILETWNLHALVCVLCMYVNVRIHVRVYEYVSRSKCERVESSLVQRALEEEASDNVPIEKM